MCLGVVKSEEIEILVNRLKSYDTFKISVFLIKLCHLPFLGGILVFLTLHLGLTSMRATASYSYEVLVAATFQFYAADPDGVSAIVGF